jgi:hypothetical protein
MMRRKRNLRWFEASGVLLVVAIVLGYLLIGRKDSGAVHADAGVTTEQAAAQAGAKVLPTDPGLSVEPK